MKRVMLIAALCSALIGCGGGNGSTMNPPGSSGQTPIDPSGNWAMTARDANGNTLAIAAMFSQVGAVVSANSITAAGNPNLTCPGAFNFALVNGSVLNVNQFSGSVTSSNAGTLAFTSTLNPGGTHFDGTYSGVSACSGVASSGTFVGDEVPSTSGSWNGTLQPCSFNFQTGQCALVGGPVSQVTFVLTQNDSTGNVTGTYSVSNLSPFTTGAVSIIPPADILSGLIWQFTMTDSTGAVFVVNGKLDLSRNFTGQIFNKNLPGGQVYQLSISH